MNTDTLFRTLAKSSMRLGGGLFLSVGLALLLVVTNLWAILRLMENEQEKADLHFSWVLKNIREQEVFLQAISDRLVEPTNPFAAVPVELKHTLQFSEFGSDIYQISEGVFSLPFMVQMSNDSGASNLNALSSIGWHLTNYYSRFWAQSSLLSPQVFLFSPESLALLVVPAIGEFRDENLLTRQNYVSTTRNLYHNIITNAEWGSRHVHWVRPATESESNKNQMEISAYITGELPISRTQAQSGMNRVMVATLFDMRHSGEGVSEFELPFHGQFALVGPNQEVLIGRLEAPAHNSAFAFTDNGLSITRTKASANGEQWVAQYFIDYSHLAQWASLPVLGLFGLSILLSICFRFLYVYYRTNVIVPAKLAQERLVESQAFNRVVVESAPAGLVVIRLTDGELVMENQRAQQNPIVSLEVSRLFRKSGVTLSGEACMTLQECHFLINYANARYQEQDVLICVFSDVTEHQQRSVALHRAKQQADQASAAKTIFLATMSHEIRTPLYGVLGTLELLGLTSLDKRQNDYLHTMRICSTTVLDIISDVLDVSKIESGQMILEPVSFCPLQLIEQTVAAHVVGARVKNLQIYSCIDPAIPSLMFADDVKLGQILNNLLSNAVKFTSLGRVVLRCCVTKEKGQSTELQFQVTDTGIGITPEQQAHIFEPFYQAHSSNLISGTGLGLSICSQFVKLMGGDLCVVSEQGLGSSFSVRLPLVVPEAEKLNITAIKLDGRQIYVRAPVRELADNVHAWLTHWGANATVISSRSKELPEGALLVDLLEAGEVPCAWNGRVLSCEYAGPLIAERTNNGARVSAQHIRAIAEGILLATDSSCMRRAPVSKTMLPMLDLRVLVAEDNLINQAILKEQLESLGCIVTVTGNGLQALQAWRQDDFDVVLSDVNMPVMNGYEFARNIRLTNHTVPIIGITANALRDEGQRCEAAGMSSWMVKPLRLTDLLDTLSRLGITKSGSLTIAEDPASVATSSSQSAITLSVSMRGVFHDTMQKDIKAIRTAIVNGEHNSLIHILHSVSGALAMVSADELSVAFGQLELQMRQRSLDVPLIAETERALDELTFLLDTI